MLLGAGPAGGGRSPRSRWGAGRRRLRYTCCRSGPGARLSQYWLRLFKWVMNIFSAIDTMLFSQGRVNKTKAPARCVSRSWRWTGGTRTARVCELLWDRSPALRVHHMLCDTKVFPENPNETFWCTFRARAGLCVVKGNTRAKPGLETAFLEGKVPFDLLFIFPVRSCL